MKRLKFHSIDENKLKTSEILCVTDVYHGEITNNKENNTVNWSVISSEGHIVKDGESKSMLSAMSKIKSTLKDLGADIDLEKRKYKL